MCVKLLTQQLALPAGAAVKRHVVFLLNVVDRLPPPAAAEQAK